MRGTPPPPNLIFNQIKTLCKVVTGRMSQHQYMLLNERDRVSYIFFSRIYGFDESGRKSRDLSKGVDNLYSSNYLSIKCKEDRCS